MITLFYLLKEESEICHVIITVTFFGPMSVTILLSDN